jgi:hypothetical protein
VWNFLRDLTDRWEVLTALAVGTLGVLYEGYRLVKWVKAIHGGVIAALEGLRAQGEILHGDVSQVEIGRRKGVSEQRITDALEALRPSCNNQSFPDDIFPLT